MPPIKKGLSRPLSRSFLSRSPHLFRSPFSAETERDFSFPPPPPPSPPPVPQNPIVLLLLLFSLSWACDDPTPPGAVSGQTFARRRGEGTYFARWKELE